MNKKKRYFSSSSNVMEEFFIPDCNSKIHRSPKLPSPTTCLNEAENERLEKEIDKANKLLLSLVSP